MTTVSRNIIGKNVKVLRLLLGLSQLKFANIVGLSKPSIINIESGKKGYNLDLMEKISTFSGYSLSELSNQSFNPASNLREQLIQRYRGDANYKILGEKPEIVYAIKYKLLKSNFLDIPKEINQIKQYLIENFGWEYRGTSISNALKRMPELIEISKHDHKVNTHVYRKKMKH